VTESRQVEADRLDQGLQHLELNLAPQQRQHLLQYLELLHKWNGVYNLTAVRERLQMVGRHLLDSLAILPLITDRKIRGKRLLDIGTGAGLPGIPIAICLPELSCTLLDSNGKKTRFVQQSVTEMALGNVTVVQSRVEDCVLAPFDLVVARAFSSPVDIIHRADHLCAKGGTMVFMMGRVESQFDQLPEDYLLDELIDLDVPFTDATRHVALVRRQ